jgi:hypothetical protein
MAPCPSAYRSEPTMTPPARAVHTKPWCGASICRARNRTHRLPSLIEPCIRKRAEAARGVPGAIAALR